MAKMKKNIQQGQNGILKKYLNIKITMLNG